MSDKKIIKNTTVSDIELEVIGLTIPASSQIDIEKTDYLFLASDESIKELTPLIVSGDIVINNGTEDLDSVHAIEWIKYQDNFKQKFTIHLDPNGSDSTGDGSFNNPFSTLTGAFNAVNTGKYPNTTGIQIAIEVSAGNYDQDPVDFTSLNPNIVISGLGPRTRFVATDPNADLITLGNQNSLRSVSFEGVTGTNNFHIVYSGSGSGIGSVSDVFINGGSNGIKVISTSGIFRVSVVQCLSQGQTGTIYEANSNSVLTVSNHAAVGNGSTTIGLCQEDNGFIFCLSSRFTLTGSAVKINGDTGSVQINNISIIASLVPIFQNGDSILSVLGGNFDISGSIITNLDVIDGFYFQETPEENQLRSLSELSVGNPGKGRESAFGEGDSFILGLQAWTFDGSSFTDVSTQASSLESSTFTFPNTNNNSAIYVSTAFNFGTPYDFTGIKANVITAANLGSGDIVFEFWNGISWVEFDHMVTKSTAPYLSRANEKFETQENAQYRFDPNIVNTWEVSDPVSLGVDLYWVRFRIDGGITTAPVFEQIKLHTNRMEINEDGFQEMYGKARCVRKFPVTYGAFEAAANSPGNRDLYLSDNLFVGRVENQFSNYALDKTGFTQFLPYDTDTSAELQLSITFIGESNNSGDAEFTIYWGTSQNGEGVFQTTGQAPSTSSNERSNTFVIPFGSNERRQQKSATVRLRIPEAIIRRQGSVSDLLWVTLERDGGSRQDTYNGNVSIIELALYYQSWNEGGFSIL